MIDFIFFFVCLRNSYIVRNNHIDKISSLIGSFFDYQYHQKKRVMLGGYSKADAQPDWYEGNQICIKEVLEQCV